MPQTLQVNLERLISSAELLDNSGISHLPGAAHSQAVQQARLEAMEELENQKAELAGLCRTLKCIVDKLGGLYDEIIAGHKEEIAALSVEIARKILLHKVEKRDYQIETIVKEALKNAPTQQEVQVHLNPEDMARCQQLLQQDSLDNFDGIKFIADGRIRPADCLIETPKGIIKSFVEQHLEQIGEALAKVE